MFQVEITREKLEQLRMLADWQIRELGFNPASINAACRKAEDDELDAAARAVVREIFAPAA